MSIKHHDQGNIFEISIVYLLQDGFIYIYMCMYIYIYNVELTTTHRDQLFDRDIYIRLNH